MKISTTLCSVLIACALIACGGGGGESASSNAQTISDDKNQNQRYSASSPFTCTDKPIVQNINFDMGAILHDENIDDFINEYNELKAVPNKFFKSYTLSMQARSVDMENQFIKPVSSHLKNENGDLKLRIDLKCTDIKGNEKNLFIFHTMQVQNLNSAEHLSKYLKNKIDEKLKNATHEEYQYASALVENTKIHDADFEKLAQVIDLGFLRDEILQIEKLKYMELTELISNVILKADDEKGTLNVSYQLNIEGKNISSSIMVKNFKTIDSNKIHNLFKPILYVKEGFTLPKGENVLLYEDDELNTGGHSNLPNILSNKNVDIRFNSKTLEKLCQLSHNQTFICSNSDIDFSPKRISIQLRSQDDERDKFIVDLFGGKSIKIDMDRQNIANL